MMKRGDLQPRLFYPAKLSFRIEGQRKSFPDEKKQKEFITPKPRAIFLRRKEKIKSMNNKMAITTYLSTITLHGNRLNAAIKRRKVAE